MHTIHPDKRKSGLSLIGDLQWGTHFCLFSQTKKDQLDTLVPYFRAGLENNEFCLWITSGLLGHEDAKTAMEKAVPHFEKYAEKGQMEIIPYSRWHDVGGKSGRAIVSRLDKAISDGFDGLRLACNAFPEKKGGKAFTSSGETEAISRYNVIAVFIYPRNEFDAIGLMEVVKSHRFALVRNAGNWEVIESSEARIAKDVLRRSEEKLRSLFSNMAEGFAYHRIVLDDSGKPCDYIFLEVNDAFEKLTGLEGKKIIGKRVTEALPGIEKDPTDWIGKYGKVALTGKPVRFESNSDPLQRWFAVSAFSPHRGYFAVTFSDITERKRAEEGLRQRTLELRQLTETLEQRVQERTSELARANEELKTEIAERQRVEEEQKQAEAKLRTYMAKLEISNRELQDFAFVASHDLQEPLRKIQAFGQRLKTKYENALAEEGRDYLERMSNGAKRMQDLIQALLRYSRVTTKAEPFISVDLNRLFNEVLGDLEISLSEADGRVEAERLPTIEADPNQMRQLFQNLISNSLKFRRDEKPVIKLYARPLHQPEAKSGVRDSSQYQIFVEDNGIGFDEKYLDRIFTPFQRLHGRGTYEGAGIGLAICRKIVERHSGSITAKSVPGKGSVFIITLPAKQPKGGDVS